MLKKAIKLIVVFNLFASSTWAMPPHSMGDNVTRANVFFIQKQYREAIKVYQEVLAASPNLFEKITAQGKIAECYDNLGEFDLAVKEYEIFIQNYPNNQDTENTLKRLLELYESAGQKEKRLKILRNIIEKNPFNITYILLLGKLYEETKDFEKAEGLYESKIDSLSANPDIQERLFNIYKKKNLLDKKIDDIKKDIEQFKKEHLRGMLVNFYLWQKKYAEAIREWEKNPVKDWNYSKTLGDLYFQSGKEKEAISTWKKIFRENPDHGTVQFVASIFYNKGLLNEASALYLEARNTSSQPMIFHSEIFQIYLWQMQFEKATEESLNMLISIPLQFTVTLSEIRNIINEGGDIESIIEKLKDEIARHPDNADLCQLLAELYLEANQPDSAIIYFEKTGEINNNREYFLSIAGTKLIDKKFYKEAISPFFKIQDNPAFKPVSSYSIAYSLYNMGDYDSSLAILNKIINESTVNPYILYAYNLKGEIEISNHNLSQARETLEFFLNKQAQNENEIVTKSLFRLAEVEFLSGNFNNAKKQFVTINGNSNFRDFWPKTNFYLAEIEFLQDQFETALEYFKTFAQRFSQEPETNQALLRIILLQKSGDEASGSKIFTEIIREKNAYKFDDAEKNINGFITKTPDSALLVYFLMELGEIYSLQNRWQEALDVYKKISSMDSCFYKQEAVKQLALIYERNFKNTAKAKDEYIKLLNDFPDNPLIDLIRKKIEELNP